MYQKSALAVTLLFSTVPVYGTEEANELRKKLDDLKNTSQQQITTLEKRLQAIEQKTDGQETNHFNPEMSLILEGRYATFKNDPENYHLPGFQLGGEAGLGEEGFSLGHSEWVMGANVDDKFYGRLTAALHAHHGETEIELEEAFIQTLGLGNGLTVKAGRFFSNIGYLNSQHPHEWDFADVPLIYRGLFGDQYYDDGLQLIWLAPTTGYLELGGEVFRGERFPATASDNVGAYTLFAKFGGDIGDSHSWLTNLSYWSASQVENRTNEFSHTHEGEEEEVLHLPAFTGDSHILSLGVIWKWAPAGNVKQRNAKFQLEYFERREEGEIAMLHRDPAPISSYDGKQRGIYLQSVYQFMPQWRIGVRYDWLNSDNQGSNENLLEHAGLLSENHKPQRYSLMLEWRNSEYSQIRLQFNRDQSTPEADTQVFLQYVHSIGAHGAHSF